VQAELLSRFHCRKGQNCWVCPGGRSATGQCINQSQYSCLNGQVWNGFSCGAQAWFNSCRALEEELADQRLRMQGQADSAESLRYQSLLQQYEQCVRQFGLGRFGSYALADERLDDLP